MEKLYAAMIARMKAYRESVGCTQEQFGALLGLTQGHYSRIEMLKGILSGDALRRLAGLTGDIDYFFTGERRIWTELDDCWEKCPDPYKKDCLKLIVWAVKCGLQQSESEVRKDKSWEIAYIECWSEAEFAYSDRWRCFRKAMGLQQEKLAKALFMDIKKYRGIEKNSAKANDDATVYARLYLAYGVRPSLLIGDEHAVLADLNLYWREFDPEQRLFLNDFLDHGMKVLGNGEADADV